MELTKFGHACVRLEKGGRRLVIDPGGLTPEDTVFDGVEAVLVTHEHFDHFDERRLRDVLGVNPELMIYTCAGVAHQLSDLGDRVRVVAEAETFSTAGFTVTVVGRRHHYSNPDTPPVDNVGFLVDEEVLHAGDALPHVRVPTLLVACQAPWLTAPDLLSYLRAVKPGRTYAIHDGLLNEHGLRVLDNYLDQQAGHSGTEVRRLQPQERIQLGSV